jgi:hypothetical protein
VYSLIGIAAILTLGVGASIWDMKRNPPKPEHEHEKKHEQDVVAEAQTGEPGPES